MSATDSYTNLKYVKEESAAEHFERVYDSNNKELGSVYEGCSDYYNHFSRQCYSGDLILGSVGGSATNYGQVNFSLYAERNNRNKSCGIDMHI
jgi:hypothetical protein